MNAILKEKISFGIAFLMNFFQIYFYYATIWVTL